MERVIITTETFNTFALFKCVYDSFITRDDIKILESGIFDNSVESAERNIIRYPERTNIFFIRYSQVF